MSAGGLTAVVLTWNERDQLRRCLGHLAANPPARPLEVIVVDNGSDDGTAAMLRRDFPSVRVIANPVNRGVTKGRNQGLAAASTEFVVMLDSDAYVTPGALEAMCRHLEGSPSTGMVGPRLENPDGSLQHSCRRFPTPSAMVANRVGRLAHLRSRRRHLMLDERHDVTMDVEYVLGAAMLFRRDLAARVGGFDERIPYGYDDADWALRIWADGARVTYLPAAVVVHDYRRRGTTTVLSRHNAWIAVSYVLVRWAHRRVLRAAPWAGVAPPG